MNGPTKAHYLLMATGSGLSVIAAICGNGPTPDLGLSIFAAMAIALSLSAPMIYLRAKISLDVNLMHSQGMTIYQIMDEVSRKHYDK